MKQFFQILTVICTLLVAPNTGVFGQSPDSLKEETTSSPGPVPSELPVRTTDEEERKVETSDKSPVTSVESVENTVAGEAIETLPKNSFNDTSSLSTLESNHSQPLGDQESTKRDSGLNPPGKRNTSNYFLLSLLILFILIVCIYSFRVSVQKKVTAVVDVFDQMPPEWMNVLIFLVGVILILVGALISSDLVAWKQSLLGVGASVVASAVVAHITSRYLRAQATSNQLIHDWRIEGMYRTRAEANQLCNELLPNARQVDIIAFGLRSFRDRQSPLMKQLVQQGLQLRVLTLKPDSQHVAARSNAEKLKKGQLKSEISELLSWVSELRTNTPSAERVQLKTYDASHLDFIFRIDNIVFVGPYLHGQTSQQAITISFRKGGIGFDFWSEYFEKVWNDDSFCQNALGGPIQ